MESEKRCTVNPLRHNNNKNSADRLKIYFTADMHGAYRALSHCASAFADTGKMHPAGDLPSENNDMYSCIPEFCKDSNTLVLDGGDTFQGSLLSHYLFNESPHRSDRGSFPAKLMNLGGYDFITLGNHDFSFGREALEKYLTESRAVCLCANIEGLRNVRRSAVVTLDNGLRVGLTGLTNPCIPQWEPSEYLEGIVFSDAFSAARRALEELRQRKVDLTICMYHGGYEIPPESIATDADQNGIRSFQKNKAVAENQGLQIAGELGFDVLLTCHQHHAFSGTVLNGTFTCQPPDGGSAFIRLDLSSACSADSHAGSGALFSANCSLTPTLISAPSESMPEMDTLIDGAEKEMENWNSSVLGTLDIPLPVGDHLTMALQGSLLANFINQVMKEVSCADIACTALRNTPSGIGRKVTNGAVVSAYPYPNTLTVLQVNRDILKAALERSAEYFVLDESGHPQISPAFLSPMQQHFNYDYFSGIEYVFDLSKPMGERVLSICYHGEELAEDRTLTLALNNYRASGTGGYPFYASCPIVTEIRTEIAKLISGYLQERNTVTVDQTKWFSVINTAQ